jgi:hypothetical protein
MAQSASVEQSPQSLSLISAMGVAHRVVPSVAAAQMQVAC